jgi:hypothetical protein
MGFYGIRRHSKSQAVRLRITEKREVTGSTPVPTTAKVHRGYGVRSWLSSVAGVPTHVPPCHFFAPVSPRVGTCHAVLVRPKTFAGSSDSLPRRGARAEPGRGPWITLTSGGLGPVTHSESLVEPGRCARPGAQSRSRTPSRGLRKARRASLAEQHDASDTADSCGDDYGTPRPKRRASHHQGCRRQAIERFGIAMTGSTAPAESDCSRRNHTPSMRGTAASDAHSIGSRSGASLRPHERV